MGPGTKLAKRLKRGDPGINRLDKIAKQHDIDYSKAKNLRDKWKADTRMIKAIDKLPGSKTMTEKIRDLKHRQRNGTTTTGGSKIFPREGSAHV